MRADRLISILIMLQEREQVTAAEVAAELEVSERTARRDLDALAVAGLPVYSQVGRGGGWRLAGDGRTDLSVLTSDEARSVVLAVSGAAHLGESARTALQKLQSALPDASRSSAMAAAAVTIVEPVGWEPAMRSRPSAPPPLLDVVHRATVANERIALDYRSRSGDVTAREVDPLLVVDHGGTWYLIAETERGRRTFRIDRVMGATPTGRFGERPAEFDAASVWYEVRDSIDGMRAPVRATIRARRSLIGPMSHVFGRRVHFDEPHDPVPNTGDDGWVGATLRGHSVSSIAWELAGFGGGVDVVSPDEVQRELARLGRELVDRYDAGVTGGT